MESLPQTSPKSLNPVETKWEPWWNYTQDVRKLFPSLPLDFLPFGFPKCLPCFFGTEKKKKLRISTCFLNTIAYFPRYTLQHVLLLARISIVIALTFLLGGVTPPSQFLQILWHIFGWFCCVFSCCCFICETSDESKHRIKIWAHNRFGNLYMRLLCTLHHFVILPN